MTDELSLQQQQVGNNAIPGLLGGAVIGGAGGAATSYWTNLGYKSKADYDKVIAMKEDTFKKQIENAGDNKGNWEKAQEIAKKVNEANSEYDKAIDKIIADNKSAIGQLPDDNPAKKALDAAQKNYDAELARKTASKNINVGSGVAEIVAYDPEWKMGKTAADEYKALYKDLESARTALSADPNYTNIKNDLVNRRNSIETTYKEIMNDAKGTINPKGGKKDIKSLEQYLKDSKGQGAIETALELNDIVKLSDRELISLAGGEKNILATMPATTKPHHKVFPVTKKDGTVGFVEIQTEKGGIFSKKTPFEKAFEKKFEQVQERYTSTLKEYIEAQEKLDKLGDTFKIDKSQVKVAGLEREADGSIKDLASNLEKFLSESADYAKEMKQIEDAGLKDFANKKGVTIADTTVEALMTKYSADSPKELYNMLATRFGIARRYKGEKDALSNVINGIIEKDETLSNLTKQKTRIESNFKVNVSYSKKQQSISGIESRIRNQFGEYLKVPKTAAQTVAGMTEEEARKALEDSDVAKILKQAQSDAEEAAKKLGLETKELSREDAIKKFGKSKEEYTKKVVEDAKEDFKKIAENLKIKNHWVTAAIGAGALALIGLGIGASQKKTAPVAEEA